MFGIGIGLLLSPITSAVLAATPPARAGLASSMVNTSRQLGGVLGIAVLGALVENQEASNLTRNLINLHIPVRLSDTIANTIATAGANASAAPLHLPARLPLPNAVLHEVIGKSFVDAVHPSFVDSALPSLCGSLLGAALVRHGVRLERPARALS